MSSIKRGLFVAIGLAAVAGIGFAVYDLTTGRKAAPKGVAKASALPVPAGGARTDTPGALWGKSCEAAPDGKQACAVIQNIVITDKNTNQSLRALAVAVGYMPGGDTLRMALTVPLGINLPTGVGFQIDDGKANTLPVETCIADGCHIIMSIDAGGRDSLVKSKLIKVTYQLTNGQKVSLPIELTGFGEALAQLTPSP